MTHETLNEKIRKPMGLFGTNKSKYGILVWFSIFAVIVPYVLITLLGVNSMLRYLPIIDLAANILTNAGDERSHSLFNDVYDINPNAFIDYLTVNIINVLALFGVVITVLYETHINKKSDKRGMTIAVIMFILTYLLPTRLIGLVGQESRRWMAGSDNVADDKYGWFGTLMATSFTMILVLTEFYIVSYLV